MFRLTLAALISLASPAVADRIIADANCAPTEIDLRFNCEFNLTQNGVPVEGASFTIKPDMPSMPMAHNIPPVPADITERPGAYVAVLDLQMLGDWTLTLDVSAPRRDRIVLSQIFDDAASDHLPTEHSGHSSD
ncbi:FixH family protein [Marivita hallyeonensis]|uniref:YtkA-like n=1 Tax=Marivita hallyeonensis TaxID=996342 RepID=A0A1M5SAV5_9RHOB|nr:FixH family protein [Marivita hallyeonensis]SHH35595.1 YtkA-like [Marivita hallyeonensis]